MAGLRAGGILASSLHIGRTVRFAKRTKIEGNTTKVANDAAAICEAVAQRAPPLNGAGEKAWRNDQSQHLGGFGIDDQFESARLLGRDIADLCSVRMPSAL